MTPDTLFLAAIANSPDEESKEVKVPFFSNLPACATDIDDFNVALARYNITDRESFYTLHNATWRECGNVIYELK